MQKFDYLKLSPLQKELYRELLKRDCYFFAKTFWDEIDSHPFIDGILIQFFCEFFQYMARPWVPYNGPEKPVILPEIDENTNVIDVREDKHNANISLPPRHGKSNVFSCLCACWLFVNAPIKVASVSHSQTLAAQMNIKRQKLLNSEKFKFFFPEITLTTNSTYSLRDSRGGEMYSVPKTAITGMGADLLLIDDLTNVDQARRDAAEMSASWSVYRDTLPSRINDINKYVLLNIQQRIAPNDITGRILNEPDLASQYIFAVMPAQFKQKTYIVCPISGDVYEYDADEYLWPERFGNYMSLRMQVGESVWRSQYLQDPQHSDKVIIKPEMITIKDACDVPDISQAQMIYASHDFPVKDKDSSDFLGSVLAYRVGAVLYITDALEKKMAFVESVNYVRQLDNIYPGIIQVIEDKANGSPILQQLRDEVPGMQAFQPGTNSKTQRLESASLYMNSGNVVFVRSIRDDGTRQYHFSSAMQTVIDKLLAFPFLDHDDVVDAVSMLVLFVFMDRRYMVYGRSFNEYNIINAEDYETGYDIVFFNREGDIWKALDIGIQYAETSKLIVKKEILFKASVAAGIEKLKDFSPDKSVFIDASAGEGLAGMYLNDTVIEKYEVDNFDQSVAQLNLAFANNTILIDDKCNLLKGDIDNFKFDKTGDDTAKYKTERDGFLACIRIAMKYFGGF